MKYIRQFAIICGISLVGEALNYLLKPLPVPASIWGMAILFLLLFTKTIKVEQIENVADFLLLIMPLTFVPLGAQLLVGYDSIKNDLLGIVAVCTVSTFAVFFVTAFFVQFAKKIKKEGE